MRRWLSGAWVAALLFAAFASGSRADDPGIGEYPLDAQPRVLPPHSKLPCDVPLATYRGEHVRFSSAARVYPAFVDKLRAFEAVLVEQAVAHYGRAPRVVVHLGTQSCRRMRLYPDWVSEHALANAIDVAGFDFGPLPAKASVPEGLPRALRYGFSVRIDKHWHARGAVGELHSRFLHDLAHALIARPDIFRVVLGPAYPGHKNHFHLDYAPYRVVEVFDDE
jgi:hypothetical protein